MIKINRVIIQNFQSHESTSLDFTDGLNVITGPSDQGKSAVIRAIKWALYNEPRGTEFIRHGTSGAKVAVELSNGCTIIRERTKSRNRYTIIKPDGREVILEGFGNEVPDEVLRAHRMPKVVLDRDFSSSLNMADQLEGPFLLSEPGSVRAKAIGRLTGLHVIDKAIRDCIADLRRENQNRERLGKELENLDKELEKYKDLDKTKKAIDYAGESLKRLEGLVYKVSRLGNIKQKINTLDSEYLNASSIIKKTTAIEQCSTVLVQAEKALSKLNRLKTLSEKLRLTDKSLSGVRNFISRYGEVIKAENSLDEIIYKVNRLNRLEDLRGRYIEIQSGILEVQEYLEKNKYEMDSLIGTYKALLKDAARCPLCNSKISDAKLENIIRHYREVH